MATGKKYIDILMVGKTGNGKSATGNTILDRNAFKSEDSMDSVTKIAQFDYSEFEGTVIKVVDGPGVGDTKLDSKKAIQLVLDAMHHAIEANPEGYHALLLVVPYGKRFTEEDVKTIEVLKKIFGEGFVKHYAILVMTYGDDFHRKNSGKTFEQWCKAQTGVFSKLLSECGHRAVLFDNQVEDKNAKIEQMRRLLAVINSLSESGARYTNEDFKKAQKSREKLYNDAKRPRLHENAVREAGLITFEFSRIDRKDTSAALCSLNALLMRAEDLIQDILEQDKTTNALSSGITMAQGIKDSIVLELKRVEEESQLKQTMEDLKRKEEEYQKARHLEEEQEQKRRDEERRRREEDEKKRKRDEEERQKKREEEEKMRIEEEKKRREEDEKRRIELAKIKDEEERRKAAKEEEERKEAQRQEDDRREAKRREEEKLEKKRLKRERELEQERREAELKREIERLQQEKERDEKKREEDRRMQEEMEKLRRKEERLEKESEKEKLKMEAEYKAVKEKESQSWMESASDFAKKTVFSFLGYCGFK